MFSADFHEQTIIEFAQGGSVGISVEAWEGVQDSQWTSEQEDTIRAPVCPLHGEQGAGAGHPSREG